MVQLAPRTQQMSRTEVQEFIYFSIGAMTVAVMTALTMYDLGGIFKESKEGIEKIAGKVK